jgi:hypothetical protein
MKYRDLMTLTAAIAFTCGIFFALGPPALIPHFYFFEGKSPLAGWPPPPQWIAYSLGRVLGGALVLIGVIAWNMRNLGRDLHDSIKQQIFSVNVAAATAQTRWESDPEGAQRALADVRGSAREAMVGNGGHAATFASGSARKRRFDRGFAETM